MRGQPYRQYTVINVRITSNWVKVRTEEREVGYIVGLSELRERGERLITLKSSHSLYYVGDDDKAVEWTGFLIHKRQKKDILSLKKISTWVVCFVLKLNTRYKIKIIRAYAPTTNCDNEEVDLFCDNISAALNDQPRTNTLYTVLICGNFNAKINWNE